MQKRAHAWAAAGVGVAVWAMASAAQAEETAAPTAVEYLHTTTQKPLSFEVGATTRFEWFDPEQVAQLSVTHERFALQPLKLGRVVLRRHAEGGAVSLVVIDVREPLHVKQLPGQELRGAATLKPHPRLQFVPKIAAARRLLLQQSRCRQANDSACAERVQGEIEKMKQEQPGSFETREAPSSDSIGRRD